MQEEKVLTYIEKVLKNMPSDWLQLTTHRLDIYNEEFAKVQFLDQLEALYEADNANTSALSELPTAFDYIRLGHPLSCLLEWALAKLNDTQADNVISFSSQTIAVLAVLRTNLFAQKKTRIIYSGELPACFDFEALEQVYSYDFELVKLNNLAELQSFEGSQVLISSSEEMGTFQSHAKVDFLINTYPQLGSILWVTGAENDSYVSDIQHVRRRETIAMTPDDSFSALKLLIGQSLEPANPSNHEQNKAKVLDSVRQITGTKADALLGSCGLSVQYAIMMGLIDDALEKHPGKDIKIIVPPNCYGGTNDQARRVAASLKKVEVMDLPVDGDNDMVQSIDIVLKAVAEQDAVPYIIAEIPTNPRVEVPDLQKLKEVLSEARLTSQGDKAVDPVFILDQTFCPNVQFAGAEGILANIRTISYVSGSKFPSGGKCTAGYCVANEKAENLLAKIDKHLVLCDNEATNLQVAILAKQLPSMLQRIKDAYKNTREFVNFIETHLPQAKINFVSEELAQEGFTPSVFSLDLPTKGNSPEEREAYKRKLNLKLINMMITEIPTESKYCVSYGQLKGCYWTIPATSTQGTTKEDDKDYIARVSISPDLDLEHHKKVFLDFVAYI